MTSDDREVHSLKLSAEAEAEFRQAIKQAIVEAIRELADEVESGELSRPPLQQEGAA